MAVAFGLSSDNEAMLMAFMPAIRARRQQLVAMHSRLLSIAPPRKAMMKPGSIAQFVPETLVSPPPLVPAHLNDHEGSSSSQSGVSRTAQALAQDSFCLCKGAIDDAALANAAVEVKQLFDFNLMSPGEFVVAGNCVPGARQRQDRTLYLAEHLSVAGCPEDANSAQLVSLDKAMAKFGEAVIEHLAAIPGPHLGSAGDGRPLHCTGRTDLMLACYPGGGSAYGAHIDNRDGDGRDGSDHGRCFALVYYLNESWNLAENGGALRLHLPKTAAYCASLPRARVVLDVDPNLDTMVMFRADQLVHEVRRTYALRFAATMWFFAGTRP